MGDCCCISKVLDNSGLTSQLVLYTSKLGRTYQEQRECIEWQAHRGKPQAEQPTARILKGFTNSSPAKLFFTDSITVCVQARVDESTLSLSEKFGSAGVVLDEPECRHSDQHGSNTFLSMN